MRMSWRRKESMLKAILQLIITLILVYIGLGLALGWLLVKPV